jgi:hypothetical protein
MNLGQRVVFVDEGDPVAIFFENLGKQRLVHPRTERTLEVVKIDDYNLGGLGAARRPAGYVDLAHQLGERILGQIEPRHSQHCAAILGQQKFVVLLLPVAAVDVYRDSIIPRHISTGSDGSNDHFYLRGNGVESTHLMLDLASYVGRRGLGNTTQANQKQDEQRTSN